MSLREVVHLSRRCVQAAQAGDWLLCCHLMTARDELYKQLGAFDARTYIEWAFNRMTDAEIDLVIGIRAPEHDPGDEDRFGAVLS